MAESTPCPLVVELWYTDAPDLGESELLEALRSLSPATQAQMESSSYRMVMSQCRC